MTHDESMHGNLLPADGCGTGLSPVDNVTSLPYESQREAAATLRRLSRQCRAILTRLQQGPASNRDLAAICLKYTGRISDLRKAGYNVECYDQDRATGLSWYRLAARQGGVSLQRTRSASGGHQNPDRKGGAGGGQPN